MLRSRQINAAFLIHSGELPDPGEYFFHKVMDDRYVAVLSEAHPLAEKPVLAVRDLDGQDILMPARASAFRMEIEQLSLPPAPSRRSSSCPAAASSPWRRPSRAPFTMSRCGSSWITRLSGPLQSSYSPTPFSPRHNSSSQKKAARSHRSAFSFERRIYLIFLMPLLFPLSSGSQAARRWSRQCPPAARSRLSAQTRQ